MKHLILIQPHSFVDLITNSSSELFVCNTKKSVSMVKDVLEKLLETYNEITDSTFKHTFENCFGEIHEAVYTLDLNVLSKDVVEEYKKYHRDYDSWNDTRERPQSYIDAREEEQNLQKTHPYYGSKFKKGYNELTDKEQKERDSYWKDYLSKTDVIWTKYGSEKLEATGKLFIEFLKYNSASPKDIVEAEKVFKKAKAIHTKNKSGKHVSLWYSVNAPKFSKNVKAAYEVFDMYNSWSMTVKKGNILVYSKDDNSIPFELFDLLDNCLSARHYHLG